VETGRTGRAGVGLALVSAATFGTSGAFAGSLLQAGWTPGSAVTVRVCLAALVLTGPGLYLLRGRRGQVRRSAGTLAAYGIVAVAGAQLCYFYAVAHLPVAVALLLEYSGVLLVVLWLWVRHDQRPRRLTVAGAVVSLVGLVLVLDLFSGGGLDLVGVLWGLGAASGLATYFVLSASTENPLPPLVVAWDGLVIGGVVLLAAGATGLLPHAAPRTDVVLLGHRTSWVVPVLGLSLVAAVIAYTSGIVGARLLGAKLASFVGLTEVLFAVLFAWLLLGQVLALVQLLGAVLVVGGIVLVRVDEIRDPTSAQVLQDSPVLEPLG